MSEKMWIKQLSFFFREVREITDKTDREDLNWKG